MTPLFFCLLLTTTLQVHSSTINQELRSVFQVPNRRNYDDLEIIERSNFESDDSASSGSQTTPSLTEIPKSYANAQVMLRFGGDGERKCACGEVCQCRTNPYYVPVLTPIPYCLCLPQYPTQYYSPPPLSVAPPPLREEVPVFPFTVASDLITPKSEYMEVKTKQTDSQIKNEKSDPEENLLIKNNHPEILETVKLTDAAIKETETEEDINKIKCMEEVSNKVEPTELSPNLKIVNLDLSKVTKIPKRDLEQCLIPYSSPKSKQPKLLVTYPIFNKNNEMQYRESGYAMSEGSGYYADPVKTVIYKKPTVVSVYDKSVPTSKYIFVPVNQVAPVSHSDDCCCCSCKYVGELNEKCV